MVLHDVYLLQDDQSMYAASAEPSKNMVEAKHGRWPMALMLGHEWQPKYMVAEDDHNVFVLPAPGVCFISSFLASVSYSL
jgi:hypothetical protein